MTVRVRTLGAALCLAALAASPRPAAAQALPNLALLRVGYNTRKATVRPEGALKAQIDEIDRQLAEAARLGENGEMRRLFAKGSTLLAGRPWTDALDFAASLTLRAERVVVDASRPYTVRLEQIYRPSLALDHPLEAQVTLRRPPVPSSNGQPPQPGEVVKRLGTFQGIARDLREAPFGVECDLRDVADGGYVIQMDVVDGAATLGTASLAVSVQQGLDALVQRLEADAARAPDALRADILYPVDRMRNVNRGRLELRTFDPLKDLSEAQAVAAAAQAGRDPFAGRTGTFKRHYRLESADEIMPYRVQVPRDYEPGRAYPLVVALHGIGGTEDYFYGVYDGALPAVADRHGYIVVAPLGYRVDGGYGWGVGTPPADPAVRRSQALSEEDVMHVLRLVREQFTIDATRIYLLGHSMGGIGAWKIAAKYPDLWAAIAPISGNGAPATLAAIARVPEIVVHGDADATVNVQGSRAMVAQLKAQGSEVTYIEVAGGSHRSVIAPNLDAVFTFFDAHRKTAAAASGR